MNRPQREARMPTVDTRQMRRCARCGVEREARKTSALCRDCRHVLTAPEREAWAA